MAARSCTVCVLGGGNAAGYFARAAAEDGLQGVLIVGDEPVVSYERPALSKGYLFPEGAARLPGFHTCVGGGGARQEPGWYQDKGIEFLTDALVTSVDVTAKRLALKHGGSVAFEKLVIATGARPIHLADFGAPGASLPGIHVLRNVADADSLLADLAEVKKVGGKVVVVGGGYIGMEAAAGIRLHGVDVTVIFPEDHLMARILPPELAAYYERFYEAKGIQLVKGATAAGFKAGPDGRVASVLLKDGTALDASLVVVGVGARPNAELFEGQLEREARGGGLVVDGLMRCHKAGGGPALDGVFAIGDVAAFPQSSAGGAVARQEHVTHARLSAAQAEAVIAGKSPAPYDSLPFFYSRVFSLSWVFYGAAPPGARVVPFGVPAALEAASQGEAAKFGAFWVEADAGDAGAGAGGSRVVGVFLESGSPEEAAAAKAVAAVRPAAPEDLGAQGAEFLLAAAAKL